MKCTFRRTVSDDLYQLWLEVVQLVSTVHLSDEEDEMIWKFTSKGTYSSQSLYKVINFRGVKLVHVSAVWGIKVPPRVHMFLWLLINNRTLTRDNLTKRRKVEDATCLFCVENESCHHLFFDCAVARRCWTVVSDILGIQVGGDIVSIGQLWLSDKKNSVINMITSAVLWSIWKLRNELCFQRSGWKSMEVLFYKILGLLQNWTVLCPVNKRERLDGFLENLKTVARRVTWLPDIPRNAMQSASET